tara:strand:+ start:103 stop:432 length:330 start_codon:yes stop_codon:yes gene_type:complete
MKLSLTINQKTYSIETDEGYDGSDLNTIAEEFKGLLVNAGFHPSNVDNLFNTDYQWFTEEERNDNLQGHLKNDKFNEGYAKGWDQALHNKKVQDFQDNLYKQDDNDYIF